MLIGSQNRLRFDIMQSVELPTNDLPHRRNQDLQGKLECFGRQLKTTRTKAAKVPGRL
jgi:hypothetical protein